MLLPAVAARGKWRCFTNNIYINLKRKKDKKRARSSNKYDNDSIIEYIKIKTLMRSKKILLDT